jgi:O-antigen/teichoic acid export membrane protein
MIKRLISLTKSNLYKNSFFLILSSLVNISAGFIFYILAARSYPAEQIGYATTLLSSLGIIASISIFGLDESIIKYYNKEKDKLIGTSISIVLALSFFTSILFAVIISSSINALSFSFEHSLTISVYVLSCMSWTFFLFLETFFIIQKKTEFIFAKNIIYNIFRLGMLAFLAAFGFFGIFYSWIIPASIALIISLFWSRFRFRLCFDYKLIKRIFRFSLVNHVSKSLYWLKSFVITIMITYFLGPAYTAFFFIPYKLIEAITQLNNSFGKSLYADISTKKSSLSRFRKIVFFNIGFMILAGSFMILAGRYILSVYGGDYAVESYPILVILGIALIPLAFNELLYTWVKHKADYFDIFLIKGGASIMTLLISFIFIRLGSISIAYAMLASELAVSMYIFKKYLFFKGKNGAA